MGYEHKYKIEELLSGYIDDELSQRKETELKRLMEHDDTIAVRLEELKKQKALLNSLPASTAPKGILDEVMGTMERKFILNEYSAVSDETEGQKNLFLRRLMTAAIIMVLFGGLLGLVINIVMPAGVPQKNYVAGSNQQISPIFDPGVKLQDPAMGKADTPVFVASLNLHTHHTIAMNDFVKKAVFNHNLNDFVTPPKNDGSESMIKVTCSIDKIIALLGDLQAEWGRCSATSLAVYDHAMSRDILIDNVSCQQVLDIFKEEKFYARMQKSKDTADFNTVNSASQGYFAASGVKGTGGPVKIRPELTSVEKRKDDDTGDVNSEQACLVIRIIGL